MIPSGFHRELKVEKSIKFKNTMKEKQPNSKPIKQERKPEQEKKHIKKDGRIRKPKGTVYKRTASDIFEDAMYDGFWSKEVGS